MTQHERTQLQSIITLLRSGDTHSIEYAERWLLRLAALGGVTCRCEHDAEQSLTKRTPQCYVHEYFIASALKAISDAGDPTDLRASAERIQRMVSR